MTERLLKTNLWYKGLVTGHYLCRGVGEREKYVGKIKILLFPPPLPAPPPPLSLQISSIYLSIIKIHATDNHKLITLCLTLTLGNALLLKCTSNCRPPSKLLHKKFSPPPPPPNQSEIAFILPLFLSPSPSPLVIFGVFSLLTDWTNGIGSQRSNRRRKNQTDK